MYYECYEYSYSCDTQSECVRELYACCCSVLYIYASRCTSWGAYTSYAVENFTHCNTETVILCGYVNHLPKNHFIMKLCNNTNQTCRGDMVYYGRCFCEICERLSDDSMYLHETLEEYIEIITAKLNKTLPNYGNVKAVWIKQIQSAYQRKQFRYLQFLLVTSQAITIHILYICFLCFLIAYFVVIVAYHFFARSFIVCFLCFLVVY